MKIRTVVPNAAIVTEPLQLLTRMITAGPAVTKEEVVIIVPMVAIHRVTVAMAVMMDAVQLIGATSQREAINRQGATNL